MNRNSHSAPAAAVAPSPRRRGGAVQRLGAVLLAGLGLLALLCGPRARAADDYAALKPGEGLVLLVIDNGIGASSIRLDGPGIFGDGLARELGGGINVRLMRLPAGEYFWSRANAPTFWGGYSFYALSHSDAYRFRVEAGVINYPGDFLMHSLYGNYSLFRRVNRAALAMTRLDRKLPGVRARFPWRMDVAAADPFPAFFAEQVPADRVAALADSADAAAKRQRQLEVPEDLAALYRDLFVPAAVQAMRLSPAGGLIAYAVARKDRSEVMLFDAASGASRSLGEFAGTVADLEWGGDRTLLIDYSGEPVVAASTRARLHLDGSLADGVQILRLGSADAAASGDDVAFLPHVGLLDALPDDPRRALVTYADSFGGTHVYAVDKAMRRFSLSDVESKRRLDKGLERPLSVFVDTQGRIAAAVAVRGSGDSAMRMLVAYRDGSWRDVRRLPDDERLSPVMLTADGTGLLALTDSGRAQVELVRLDLASGEIGDTVVTLPGTDIVAPLVRRHDRSVIGATYFEAGMLRARYVDATRADLTQRLAAQLPGAEVQLWDLSRDGMHAIVFAYSETDPGVYYYYDVARQHLHKLVGSRADFAVARPVASKVFTVRSADGLDIESYLTLPSTGEAPHPLVVMPHGGPIGMADRRSFSPDVQLLAHRGFAVLRVNYRGSSNAGKAFRTAGEGQWGRQIEEDVEQALDHALAHFPLDRGRVALLGASYGGYSTLMELIRRPERFRCGVAVSAPTDLPLLFSSSDWNHSAVSVQRMKHVVGDPATSMEALRQYSPDYQYARLTRPVLLIHGTADARVSLEHAWRLYNLLANAGREPAWLPLPGGDHALARPNDNLAVQVVSDRFLHACLAKGEGAAGGDRGAPSGSGL